MLDAARLLAVGEVSDPIQTEEGWFLVQHTSDYDEDGTEYWKEYLTEQAKEEESSRIYDEWEAAADIQIDQEILDQVIVKHVLKELL
jgi:parvulin-like peptidyl-prolyl isomerase